MRQRQRNSSRLERRFITLAVLGLGAFDLISSMLPGSLVRFAELEHVAPRDAIRGSHFGLVILGLLFIFTARGLWHGKQLAWLTALGAASASVALHLLRNVELPGVLFSLVLVGALLATRSLFPARMEAPTLRRGLALLAIAVLAAFAYSALGLYFFDGDFRHQIPLGLALADSVRLLFVLPSTQSVPVTRHGALFLDTARVAFLSSLGFGLMQLLSPAVFKLRTDLLERSHAERILQTFGGSALAFFALLPDKSYFFSKGDNAFLAYGVKGSSAVVLGDLLGKADEFDELLDSFQEYCELNGWTFGFTQATPARLSLYEAHGLKALKTGEEAVIDIASFSLSGTTMKHLRATMNRFSKEGYRAKVYEPPHSRALVETLRGISDDWLAQGGRRERTFTLGYFDEGQLQHCEVMVAETSAGEPVAFANIVPCYTADLGTFDMLRYRREPKAMADFLCISLIEHFREQGLSSMSLGLAPFSGIERKEGRGATSLAMRLIYRFGGALLRYQGLHDFKAKFQPVWEPRYLIFESEAKLPGIAIATMQIGELERRREPSGKQRSQPVGSGSTHTSAGALG